MKKITLTILFFIVGYSVLFSQQVITGHITDETGSYLPGVNVLEKGTTNGTITDLNGNYNLTITDTSSVLVYSFMGYLAQEIKPGFQTSVDVSLSEDILRLDDVVVVGYGTAKKSDLTGAITSIKPDELNSTGVTNAAQMLQGRVTGLYISSHNQNPGATPEFILRGASSFQEGDAGQPLVVIDGFPMENTEAINTINPSDIEQIDVLKDASATAIYGSRGANGVIIITTKQGNQQGIQVDYSARFFTQTKAREVELMDGPEYARFYYDLAHDDNLQIGTWGPSNGYPHYFTSWDTLANTDWQNEVINKGNLSQEHSLSLSGVREGVKYRAAVNYYDGKGIISPTSYRRINSLARLDYDYKKFSFNLDFNYTYEKRNLVSNSYERALGFSPTSPVRNADGELSEHAFSDISSWYYNPLLPEDAEENFSDVNTVRISGGVQYEIIDGLRASVKGGFTTRSEEEYYQRFKKFYESDTETEASITDNNSRQTYADVFLNYTKQIGDHKLMVMAGGSYQSYLERGLWVSATDFPYADIAYYNINSGLSDREMGSDWYQKQIMSALARLNYDYKGKYLLTVNYRLDGATVFGENNKWGQFPSFGLAYRIDQEEYFKDNVSFLTVLKLKTGYGIAGNANIPGFRTQNLYDFVAAYEGGSVSNAIAWGNTSDDDDSKLYLANPDLRWENTYTFNLGLEFGNSNFYTELGFYNTNHNDLILDRQLPTELGFTNITVNKGAMLNRGFEAKLDLFLDFFNERLFWKPTLTFSYNKNEITDMDDDQILAMDIWLDNISYGYAGIQQQGFPLNAIWGYDFIGVWQEDEADEAAVYNAEPGDPKYADINGYDEEGNVVSGPDGEITEEDKKYLGDANPRYTAGFNNQINFKNFELSFFFEGVFKKSVVNVNKATYSFPSYYYGTNKMRHVLDRWTSTNPSNEMPSLTKELTAKTVLSDWTVEDASFVRLRDITFAYKLFPESVTKIKNMRIYISVSNVFTITKYSGVNPDVWGIDDEDNLIPYTRLYTCGVNVSF